MIHILHKWTDYCWHSEGQWMNENDDGEWVLIVDELESAIAGKESGKGQNEGMSGIRCCRGRGRRGWGSKSYTKTKPRQYNKQAN